MGPTSSKELDPVDEYHSFVVRVRAAPGRSRTSAKPALAIRVEYVNERKAMHFSDLTSALEFIASAVRRNFHQPDP
jgi:hypothetical protein